MTVNTSAQLNPDKLQAALAALAPGATFVSSGAQLEDPAEKTIDAVGATDTQLQTAITTAAGQFVDYNAAKTTALGALQTLLGEHSALTTQLTTDIATVTNAGGWHAVAVSDQDAIMGRILTGFGTVMAAIADHLTVNGIGQ